MTSSDTTLTMPTRSMEYVPMTTAPDLPQTTLSLTVSDLPSVDLGDQQVSL